MNEDTLEKIYQERLEERLISYLAEKNNISLRKAMDIYYHSEMAEKIHAGTYGVQYLDYKVLAQMLMDSEPDLFNEAGSD
jgi:16S rRNA A1518/A1519 N6-dimethyltransferase RsmA/KsgA/DIM1 with predicted DNA glycosylase/AP lyase activity